MTTSKELIYLDFNATTPIDPAVADAMLPFLHEHFGNPSSVHRFGATARQAIEHARGQVAGLLGCRAEEVVFTSGGSESNNMVIQGVARMKRTEGRHIITCAVEHPAVLEPCEALGREGYRLTVVPVDEKGRVDPERVAREIGPDTILITIMHANNEVGTIQPISEIAAIAREKGILFHTDAAQSVGKIPTLVVELGVDFLTVAGHKLYAPKGVGALYVRAGRDLPKLIHGASHESGRRAGTENVLEIVGLGAAAELAGRDLEANMQHARKLRARLWDTLSHSVEEVRRNGDSEHCLPNTLSVSFRGIEANTLVAEIGDRVAVSAGAACHAEGVDVSTVLEAMGVPLEYAMGTIRFSVGKTTTAQHVETAAEVVADAVNRMVRVDAETVGRGAEMEEVRLTRFTHGMGCACKLRPQELEQVLRTLPAVDDEDVLVSASSSDDAAVYRLREDLAVVQTVDFFTPTTDDPYDFGAVAAANSLSDIYAMGAMPLFALSVVGFPSTRLPMEVLERIMRGAIDVARGAGISILGGHSVEDTEPKFGLVVTGTVKPGKILTNSGSRVGDSLVLTKPIGTGILSTAVKRGLVEEDVSKRLVKVMSTLNRAAAEAMVTVGVHACTDVTGFGLLGHLREMTSGSGVDASLWAESVPVISPARELAAGDAVPGGTVDNLEYVSAYVDWDDGLSRVQKLLLSDAQTSGGLLISVAENKTKALLAQLKDQGVESAAVVGRVTGEGEGRIRVLLERE